MTGIYTTAGKIATTTVAGNTYTGVYAADGSVNIVLDSAGTGIYHPCGAFRVSSATGNKCRDVSGSFHSNGVLGFRGNGT